MLLQGGWGSQEPRAGGVSVGCSPPPAPLCLQAPMTLEAQLIFKMVLQAGGRWIAAALRRELSVPRDPNVPSPAAQPRDPGSDPAWCKPLIRITRVTPALGQSVLPGAEVPPRDFWQGNASLGRPVSIPGGWCSPGGSQPNPGPVLGASLVGSAAKLTRETRGVESQGLGFPRQLGRVTGPW